MRENGRRSRRDRSLEQAGKFQLHDDVAHQHRHGRSAGFNDHVRRLAVQRIARIVQFAQTRQRILDLKQGTLQVVPQAAVQIFGRRAEVDDMRTAAQGKAIGFTQHSAAAGGDNTVVAADQFGDHRLLDVAKYRLAFPLEEFADGAADAFFNDGIGVGKRQIQPLRQTATNAGFA